MASVWCRLKCNVVRMSNISRLEPICSSAWTERPLIRPMMISNRFSTILYSAIPIVVVGASLNFHVVLHFASLILSVMLATVSVVSYRRVGRSNLLFVALAFIVLATEEFVVLAQALSWMGPEIFATAGSYIELSHLLTLGSLSFFASGLIRRN